MKKIVLSLLTLMPVVMLLIAVPGQAGGGKGLPWKPFLPADAYKVLTERSIQLIEASAKITDKEAHERIEVEAAILAGYTLSAKNPKEESVSVLRGAALQV